MKPVYSKLEAELMDIASELRKENLELKQRLEICHEHTIMEEPEAQRKFNDALEYLEMIFFDLHSGGKVSAENVMEIILKLNPLTVKK